jgi:hypothetical protein
MKPIANSAYKKMAFQWLHEVFPSYQVQCWLTILCSETRFFAKRQTVSGHPIDDPANLNRQTNERTNQPFRQNPKSRF